MYGLRTLLRRHNAPLRNHLLRGLHGTGVDVETFHTLTAREAQRAKLKLPFEPSRVWYETEAPKLLNAAIGTNGTRYDAVLIDEAQDFALEWLAAAQMLLADGEALYPPLRGLTPELVSARLGNSPWPRRVRVDHQLSEHPSDCREVRRYLLGMYWMVS